MFSSYLGGTIGRYKVLLFHVFDDNLIRNITRRGCEVSPCLNVTAPECFADALVVHRQFPGCFPFGWAVPVYSQRYGGRRDQDKEVIFRYVSLDDIRIVSFANLPDKFSCARRNVCLQNWLAAFCDPHYGLLFRRRYG